MKPKLASEMTTSLCIAKAASAGFLQPYVKKLVQTCPSESSPKNRN
jgi:hypothetical protein